MSDPTSSEIDNPPPASSPPLKDSPPAISPAWQLSATPREGWTVFIVLHAILILVSACLPSNDLEWFTCQLMFGLVITQSALAGVWLALGPGRLVLRLPGSGLWLLFATGVGGIVDRPREAWWVMLLCGAAVVVSITCMLHLGTWYFRLRLVHVTTESSTKPFQYSLKHLLILISMISVLLAAIRVVSPNFFNSLGLMQILLLALWTLLQVIAMLPMVFVTLVADGRRKMIRGLVFSTIFAVVWLPTNMVLMSEVRTFPFSGLVGIVIGFVGYLGVLQGLLLERWNGYRLVR